MLDDETWTPDEIQAKGEAQTAQSIREDLKAVTPTMLLVGPESIGAHLDDSWTAHDEWTGERVGGATYHPITGREQGTLVVGPDGISWGMGDGRHRTVWWNDVEACLALDNGNARSSAPPG